MKLLSAISIASVALGAMALPQSLTHRAAQTIYLVGDSTMAAKGANNGLTDGSDLRTTWHERIADFRSQAGASTFPNM